MVCSTLWYRNLRVGRAYCQTAQTLPIYETALQYEGPVILVHGTADRIVPYTYNERYKAGYKNASLVLLPGVTTALHRNRAICVPSR